LHLYRLQFHWFNFRYCLFAPLQTSFNKTLQTVQNTINVHSGYSQIANQKELVKHKERYLDALKSNHQRIALQYQHQVETRKKSQKELTALLERKSSWSDADVSLFTELYRTDIFNDKEELLLKSKQQDSLTAVEKAQLDYLTEIREAYSQEQLYAQKIRLLSTWWTWVLIASHLLLFLGIHFYFDPKRRKELTNEIEKQLRLHASNLQGQTKTMAQSIQDTNILHYQKQQNILQDYQNAQNSVRYLEGLVGILIGFCAFYFVK
jgi:hypothetical protein